MKVLSTKIIYLNSLEVEDFKNFELDCVSLIQIKKISFHLEYEKILLYDGLIFTSQNAVLHFFEQITFSFPSNLLFFCIGYATKKTLLKYIPNHTIIEGKNAKELATKMKQLQPKNLLHLTSPIHLNTIKKVLSNTNIHYKTLYVYETILTPHKLNLENYHSILFFSPSGVNSFAKMNTMSQHLQVCCIGKTTAKAFGKTFPNHLKLLISPKPNIANMLETIQKNHS